MCSLVFLIRFLFFSVLILNSFLIVNEIVFFRYKFFYFLGINFCVLFSINFVFYLGIN